MAEESSALGKAYRDSVSGFTGTAVGITKRFHGPTQIALERVDEKGKPEEVWFYPERLVSVDDERPPGTYI